MTKGPRYFILIMLQMLIYGFILGHITHNPLRRFLGWDGAVVKVEKPNLSASPEATDKGADFQLTFVSDSNFDRTIEYEPIEADAFLAYEHAQFFKAAWRSCVESIDEQTLCLKEAK